MKRIVLVTLIILSLKSIGQEVHYNQWLEDIQASRTSNFSEIQNAFNRSWEGKKYQRAKGYKQFRRWEYHTAPRLDNNGNIVNPYQFLREYDDYIANFGGGGDSSGFWTPLGPTKWINGSNGYNPGIGRINAITVSPHNPQVIFIAAASGGVWKTNNGGMTWVTTMDEIAVLGTSDIAIDPNDSNIIYVATGDRDGLDTYGIGVLKSKDGGTTWDTTGLSYSQNEDITVTNRLLHHPDSSGVLLAATNNGIFKTINAGISWKKVSTVVCKDLAFQPNNPNVVYASFNGFYKSTNSGNSFSKISGGLPSTISRMEIAVTPADSNYIYAIVAGNQNVFDGVYLSTDAGQTFTKKIGVDDINLLGYEQDGSDDGSQSWYDLAIAVSPTDKNDVYTGGVNVWNSKDGGTTWAITSHWYYVNNPANYSHADIHSLDFYNGNLYCGSDGGIFKFDGSAWSNLSQGLNIMQIYRLSGAKQNVDKIITGAQDNGSNLYSNTAWTHIFGADGMDNAIDPENQNRIYYSWQNGNFVRSENNGANYTNIFSPDDFSETCAWVTPLDLSEENPSVLHIACRDVYRSMDYGTTWTAISSGLYNKEITVLKSAPSNPYVVYLTNSSIVSVTKDGGQSWDHKILGYPITNIMDIEVVKNDPNQIYLCAGGYKDGLKVFYSSNGGESFENISGNLPNLPANTLVLDNEHPGAIYVGMDAGVYFKDSTLNDWIPFQKNLPNVEITELEIHYDSKNLRAATYGRGVWQSPLFPSVSGIQQYDLSHKVEVFPNPSQSVFHVDLRKLKLKNYSATVINIAGYEVKKYTFINEKQFSIDLADMAGGVYFVKIETENTTITKRIVLLH